MGVVPEISERGLLHRGEQIVVVHGPGSGEDDGRSGDLSAAAQLRDAIEQGLPVGANEIAEDRVLLRPGANGLEHPVGLLGAINPPSVGAGIQRLFPNHINAAVVAARGNEEDSLSTWSIAEQSREKEGQMA